MRRIRRIRRILSLPELDFFNSRDDAVEKRIHAPGQDKSQCEVLKDNLGLQGDLGLPSFGERGLTGLVSKHPILHGADISPPGDIFAVQGKFNQCAYRKSPLFQNRRLLSCAIEKGKAKCLS